MLPPVQPRADSCPNPYSVSGFVNSVNVGQSVQVGTIQLELMNSDSETTTFNGGLVVGRITSLNATPGSTRATATLDHQIVFEEGSTIQTEGDSGSLTASTDCSFDVIETINNIWGTKEFKKASGTVTATGTVSYCTGANGNTFIFSGTVCLQH